MDNLRIILSGHGHNVLQYLKCIIDQTEKDGKLYPVQWILYGIVVIGHVYTMLLSQSRCIDRAKAGSTRSIGLYVEFIAQISMIETCSTSYTPYTIGCRDAAQFVYKKIFPELPSEHTVPDVSSTIGACPPIVNICVSNMDIYLENLHEYKQIIQNMVNVLFSREVFNDQVSSDLYSLYYIEVINCLHEMNTILEDVPISLESYRDIVLSQCMNNNSGCHTENMSPREYSEWVCSIICH